jgi:acyl carrier protein
MEAGPTSTGGKPPGDIPRGMEVLVKKASVDAEFRTLLLDERDAAAASIGLTLDPAEALLLRAAPAAQLEAIIAKTEVAHEHRRVFLGKAAAAMLAAIGVVQGEQAAARPPIKLTAPGGARPGPPTPTQGVRPEPVDVRPERVGGFEERIIEILSSHTGVPTRKITSETHLVRDLHIDPDTARRVRTAILKRFGTWINDDVAGQLRTVGELAEAVMLRSQIGKAVVAAVTEQFAVPAAGINCRTTLPRDLQTDAALRTRLAAEIGKRIRVNLDGQALKNVQNVGQLIDLVGKTIGAAQGPATGSPPPPQVPTSRGVRPDLPGGSFGNRPR